MGSALKNITQTVTSFAKTLLACATAAAMRVVLGLGTSATYDLSPSFSVHKNGSDQSYTAGSGWVKVTFGSELFDAANAFNTTNSRFQPNIAGKYLLSAMVTLYTLTSIGSPCYIALFKNGTVTHYGSNTFIPINGADNRLGISPVVEMNGSTDYYEIFVYTAASSDSAIKGETQNTWFTGCRVG